MKKKTYTNLQILRKANARTKGVDAVLARHLKTLLPIIERRKVDTLLTNRELGLINRVREMLTARIEIAAYDAMLNKLIQMPD
jgi:hypothetical protein